MVLAKLSTEEVGKIVFVVAHHILGGAYTAFTHRPICYNSEVVFASWKGFLLLVVEIVLCFFEAIN